MLRRLLERLGLIGSQVEQTRRELEKVKQATQRELNQLERQQRRNEDTLAKLSADLASLHPRRSRKPGT